MSSVADPWRIESAYERAATDIGKQYERGDLTSDEYNEAMRELDREARAEYEQARAEAMEELANEWGGGW